MPLLLPKLMLEPGLQLQPMLMLVLKLTGPPELEHQLKSTTMLVLSRQLGPALIAQPKAVSLPIMPAQQLLDRQSAVSLKFGQLDRQPLVVIRHRQLKAINLFARAALDSNRQ